MIFLVRLKQGLIALEKSMAVLSLFLLLAFSLVQIITRNFFDFGFTHLDIISRHLVLFLAFMGAALVTEDDRHIKIDVLATFMPAHYKAWLAKPLLVLTAAISSAFAWYAVKFWQDEWRYAVDSERWLVLLELILPIGFGFLALHFLLCALTGQGTRNPKVQ